MGSLLRRQPFLAALAAVAIVLLAVIGVETGFGSRLGATVPAGVAKPASPQELKLLPSLAAVNAEAQYPETTSRPLFVPLRRPAPPAEAAPASALKRGQFVLQGVTIAGDLRIALLKEKSTGRIHRIEKGHEVNGMKLSEVTPESVTLAQGNEQEVLPLQVQKAGAAGATIEGPFGPTAGSTPGMPSPSAVHPATPQPPLQGGVPSPPRADFGPAPNPAARTAEPVTTTAPMSPEELLARRRARRVQQNQ